MIHTLGLCSGIGGIALGLERTGGFKTIAFCEINIYCRKVLFKHWPEVPQFKDIYELTKESLSSRGITRIDCITAGFPCQPFSCAGKRKGEKDERYLWPEIARLVCEIRPNWVVLENVPGLLSIDRGRAFGRILRDLAASGYDAEWGLLSALELGAPHIRDRLFLVAYSYNKGLEGYRVFEKCPRKLASWQGVEKHDWREYPSRRWGMATRISRRVDRLKCLGNAVVPQVAEWIGRRIMEVHNTL